ncbi:helix-turn-helix domain-containing protein [Streptomyces albireticuli]|uniref:HTH lysR-type domain-containing protein n=1 Tax=Streptomyces albireticuli TaxID=1940 RepID=A0A2A2D1I9_9ACTN|nr:LysR family transcriptional regulator [Streptomyces albireticuli]PAU45192.1 hypothetical protein CK936_31010 [Streptomyces albireticuli]
MCCPTLGEAARALGTTQPVLAAQIARLEHDLGKHLLERAGRGRGMQATQFGARVVTAVQ